ncbi:MAG: FAD-dependent oxidoreductase [Deltaproteobacteria bacterium]|nr:FAD-dependent oxidoreductase [Deltaproteobacteria bacterium]
MTHLPSTCDRLFSPIRIKNVTIKNRIVMTAMHLNYTPQQVVTDQLIDFYRERVAGGIGLIIIGGCPIDVEGGMPLMIGAHDDRFIPGLERFVKEMKKTDPTVVLGAQLYHAGRYAMSWLTGMQPVAPSAFGSDFNPETPRALELDEIPVYQQRFADAAARIKAAGFDLVEIIGSAGYLIPQFLSPVTNKREDEYGGSFENRARFGVETIRRVRAAVGDDYPIFMRVAGADLVPGGHTNVESAEACVLFEQAGVDAFDVTGGWHESRVPQLTMGVPRGAFVHLAYGIKQKVGVPVVACNRINDPRIGEDILRQDLADLVGMARASIADPEFANKARAGKYHLIRKCIGCNQGCFDHVFTAEDVNCLANYRAGREGRFPAREHAATPRRVVVVGGGPAGCEAARVAALRGHRVTLFEKSDRLGGALHLCAAPPGRGEFLELADYHRHALEDLGVDVRLGEEADAGLVRALAPDLVLVATGTRPVIPPFAAEAKMANVFLARDVLLGRVRCYGDTVIVGGGAVGCETALFLAHEGMPSPEIAAFLIESKAESAERVKDLLNRPVRAVAIVEMLAKVGEDIGKSTRWSMMQDLKRLRVDVRKKTKVLSIEADGVRVQSPESIEELLPCKNVVIAVGHVAENALVERFSAAGLPVQAIGDAKTPRRAIDAIEDGFQAAWAIA